MSGRKGLGDSHVVKKEQITPPESDQDEVIILEIIEPDPEMVMLADSDSDAEVGADQASTEVQKLKNKVSCLEALLGMERVLYSQMRKALLEIMEEQDKLKSQIDVMGAKCSKSSATLSHKGKRKMNDRDIENSDQGHFKKILKCANCNKKHEGVCMKGQNVCYNCGREGHIFAQCHEPKQCVCYLCGIVGHQAKFCPGSKNDVGNKSDKCL